MTLYKYDGSAAAETPAPTANLYGTTGPETLTAASGGDALWGNGGDVLVGGAGDDVFYLQDTTSRVVDQPGQGTDEIIAWRSLSLADHAGVANLKVDGDGVYAAGDSHDNVIYAGSGAEQLYGGGGEDVLVAGSGADTFIVRAGDGNDAIYGFKPATDVVRLTDGVSSFAQLQSHMSQVGADVKIDLGGGGLVLRNTQVSQLTAQNFQLQLDPAKLGAMTFHDEFSGVLSVWNSAYNPTGVWRPDYGYQGSQGVGSYTLSGNGEQQIYTSPYFRDHPGDFAESPFTANADGTLSITARASASPDIFGYHYTSGMISTKESFAQTYGYFEMRAELPSSAGGWPAFWLAPADGSWPPELDVMETLTRDPHADWTTWHSNATGTHTSHGISSYIPDTSDGFHTYGVLWTRTDLSWYVDGVEVFHQATPADMNKPMYMIANLALGGWGGAVDPSGMPATMKIDYIRSYALADGSSSDQGFAAVGHGGGYVSPPPVSPPAASPPPVSPPPASPPPPPPVSSGDHTVTASAAGGETLAGGSGHDVFVFKSVPWVGDHVQNFVVGQDHLDFSALFGASGYHGSDPIADGYVKLYADGSGTWVIYDTDGPGGADAWGASVAHLDGISTAGLTSAALFGSGGAVSPPPLSPPVSGGGAPAATPQTLVGHAGGDTLVGGSANDTLSGQSGPNYLRGGAGDDSIAGGSGFNDINGNQGADTIVGHSTVGDWLVGGQGDDLVISHGTGDDILYGNLGNDTLEGGSGAEVLRGGQGDDSIVAGSGADWISGDRGNDTIQGGTGPDTFHISSGAGLDRVLGFDAAKGDHVQLDHGATYTVSQVGADTVVDLGGGDELILVGVRLSALPSGWLFGA